MFMVGASRWSVQGCAPPCAVAVAAQLLRNSLIEQQAELTFSAQSPLLE
jgi:hypothetical protein